MNHVSVDALEKAWEKEARLLRVFAFQLLKTLHVRESALEIYLIDNREMRRLNRTCRGKDKPTTILSFSAQRSFKVTGQKSAPRFLGELYLAPSFIKERGENMEALVIHGVLHLMGYTHAVRRDTMIMERMERKLRTLSKGS